MASERRRSERERQMSRATPAGLLALALAYLAMSLLFWWLVDRGGAVIGPTWWPAAGLTLGVMTRVRVRDWPLVAATIFVADLVSSQLQGLPFTLTLLWAAANALQPVLGAAAIRRLFPARLSDFETPGSVLRFYAVVLLAGPPVSALIAAAGTTIAFDVDLFTAWRTGYAGNVVGILVVAPVVFYYRRIRRAFAHPRFAGILVVVALATAALFQAPNDAVLLRPYLLAPLLVLAAFSHGAPGAATAGLLFALIGGITTSLGYGPYAVTVDNPNGLLQLQVFTAIQLLTIHLLVGLRGELYSTRAHAHHLTKERLRDQLTGTGSRLLLDQALAEVAIDDLERPPEPAAALFLDLDGFKPINDRYGHEVGDQVLRCIASRIERQVRSSDTVARAGGDEFAVICPGVDEAHARELADRLGECLTEPMPIHGHELRVGVSVGVSWIAGPTGNPADLLRQADQAMYRVKTSRERPGRIEAGPGAR